MLSRVPCRTSRTGLLRSARRARHIIACCWSATHRSASRSAVGWTRSRRLGRRWLSCGTLDCRFVRCSCVFGRYAGTKCSRLRSSCDCRFALVHGSPLLRVSASSPRMLSLNGYRRYMSLMRRSPVLSVRTCVDPTVPPVVADPVHGSVVDHRGVISVVTVGDVYVIHRAVVLELSVVPTAAFIAPAAVAVAIIDPAIETDVRTPVALIESVSAVAPAPIAWGPEETGSRRHYPRTWHPVIIALAVGPVSRCPDVTLLGARRLLIHRQRRRTN
jgi:hypothetical protein